MSKTHPTYSFRELLSPKANAYVSLAKEALLETLYPTRCAMCDIPGEVLCSTCRLQLPYVDYWRACPRCGAPQGRVQCTECNEVILAASERDTLPFDTCACAVAFDSHSARIVRLWKDAGERRLALDMADMMAALVPPSWILEQPTVVYVPATAAALRKRGFDHGELLAQTLCNTLAVPYTPLFARPRSADQRALSREERHRNMAGRFSVLPGASVPSSVLLIDDVYTTGATLFSASTALREAGATTIHCLTFARV